MSPAVRIEHLFIVRIWYERGLAPPASWRGSVEHPATKRRFYFASYVALVDFIEGQLGGAQPAEAEL
jgi:hypothetical protein